MWGCLVFYRSHDPKRLKLNPRSIKSIFVGYPNNSKAYRLLDLDTNVVVESRDVEFIENKFVKDSSIDTESSQIPLTNLGTSTSSKEKRKDNSTCNELRRSQRARKEKSLEPDFISSQIYYFLSGRR